ncbi:MAG: EVE domain-containing protein [Ignavibacteriales bacterium CG18_big_fil_WC_8_21_14_2_50_31_20]|nr:MAG: EVE domain-containing protein [Ignavibacteriales bacterium CG18_big_fil_WC_8_21_14_2_50_31_20]
MAAKYWLVKSEPSAYSIDDLMHDKITHWDGVRNYQARNYMRDEMKLGDKVLFYHSNAEPIAVVGVCEVAKEGYPDFSAFDPEDKHFDPKSKIDSPTWIMVDIKIIEKFIRPVALDEIKGNSKLQNMKLVQRGNRLSVMPIDKNEFNEIMKLSKK